MRLRRLLVRAVAALFMLAISARLPAQTVERVEVRASSSGLGISDHAELRIERHGDLYSANGRSIPAGAVAALLAAVRATPIAAPDAMNLGLSPQRLQSQVERAGQGAGQLPYRDGSAQQKALFRAAFLDQATLGVRLAEMYDSTHTDDYPHMQVELVLDRGGPILLDSDSQNPYMVPWVVAANGGKAQTFNAGISRTLYALLPPGFGERDRLTDEGLVEMLGEWTAHDVELSWNLSGAQHASPDALTVLRTAYVVRSATVNIYHDAVYGEAWKGGKPHEENLHATLWQPTFPKTFAVEAILLHHGFVTEGAADLLSRAPGYVQMISAVPWLSNYLRGSPPGDFRLFYVHGVSLSDKAARVFTADMHSLGRGDLAARVAAAQGRAALMQSGYGNYWIILPDRTAILWRWESTNQLFLWKGTDFPARPCTDYRATTGGCAGVLVLPDGRMEAAHAGAGAAR